VRAGMGLLYGKEGKLYNSAYCEIYVPMDYFEDKFAVDQGVTIETLGLLFIRQIPDGKEGPIQLLNVPTMITLNTYDTSEGEITVHGRHLKVMVCRYLKDSYIMAQYVVQGRERAEDFVKLVLAGKVPNCLRYPKLIDIWWRNLEVSGVSFHIPSKIYELILATVYRDPNNQKRRYGEVYGNQDDPDGYSYKTGNVREIVANLSTFSGIVYEDINKMITNGVNNTLEGIDEPISPLEKIISY
jgi:hypothetical protein